MKTTELTTTEQPAIVFKGKIVGELEETIFTPELIAEKSKPLLALKINGVFDTNGAEEVKKAINKAVKMRTAVEGIEEPIIKGINAKAKKAVAAIREISKPIYDACYATQNALQATYDAWALEVKKAADKEAAAIKQRTEGRDASMYLLGMTFNGQAFVGHGKAITKENLYSLSDESFAGILEELEVLQLEQGVTGEVKPVAPVPSIGGPVSSFTIKPSADFDIGDEPVKLFDNEVYSVSVGGYTWVLTKGSVVSIPGQVVVNQQVMQSAIYSQVISTGFNQ